MQNLSGWEGLFTAAPFEWASNKEREQSALPHLKMD
jgi:hypothetical protein